MKILTGFLMGLIVMGLVWIGFATNHGFTLLATIIVIFASFVIGYDVKENNGWK